MEFEKVRDVIVETLGCDAEQVVPESRLFEDLGADSLASVELAMALEEEADIIIEEEALTGMKTVGDVLSYMENAGK